MRKQKSASTEYERRICILVSSAKQMSDCSMIKCSTFHNGDNQLTRLNGQEYPGLMLLAIIYIDGLMSTASKEQEFRLLLNDSFILYQSLRVNWINQNELSDLEIKIKMFDQFQKDY